MIVMDKWLYIYLLIMIFVLQQEVNDSNMYT